MVRGVETSILRYERQLLYNIDICSKVIQEKNCMDFMSEIQRYSRSGSEEAMQEAVNEALIGQIVMTTYVFLVLEIGSNFGD